MSELEKRLKTIEESGAEPNEAAYRYDKELAAAWRQFGGPAREAFDLMIDQLEKQIRGQLLDPRLTTDARQFVAGQANVLDVVRRSVDAAVTADPKPEDYEPQFQDPDGADGVVGPDAPDLQ